MLLHEHGDAVLASVHRHLGGSRALVTLVTDAVHDAALSAAAGIHTFDPARGELYGWFRKIVLRAAFGTLRAERRRLAGHAEVDLGDLLEQIALPDSPARDERFRTEFDEFVATLSPLEHEILRADLAAGHSVPAHELAARLGTTPDTVTSLRYRRNAKLRLWSERFRGESS